MVLKGVNLVYNIIKLVQMVLKGVNRVHTKIRSNGLEKSIGSNGLERSCLHNEVNWVHNCILFKINRSYGLEKVITSKNPIGSIIQ